LTGEFPTQEVTMEDNHNQSKPQRIESWKEIAAYLKRDVRTVIRWEKSEGLPVHRQMHQARGNVFAYVSELEAWKASRILRLNAPPLITPWRRTISGVAFAAAMLLSLVTMASGPILNPTIASAQGIVNRQVWSGPSVDILGQVTQDQKFLTFTDWSTGDLSVRDLSTGENRRLTNKGTPELDEFAEYSVPSPDGKRVAYSWYTKDGFYELRVIGIDGSGGRTLFHNPDFEYVAPYSWTAENSEILAWLTGVHGKVQIAMVSAVDGSVRVLKEFKKWESKGPVLSLSPEGRRVVYNYPQGDGTTRRDIGILSIDGTSDTPLVEHPSDDEPLAWTPDGRTVVFASDRTGSYGAWAIDIMDGKPEGSPRLVRPDIGVISPMGLKPNGSFYYGFQVRAFDVYSAAMDFTGGRLTQAPKLVSQLYTGRNRQPAWSPDGKFLAYASQRHQMRDAGGMGGQMDTIVIRSLETEQEREIAPALKSINGIMGLHWAPDGHSLYVVGDDLKDQFAVFGIDAQTGAVSTLVKQSPEGYAHAPVATPDGKLLIYRVWSQTKKNTALIVLNLESGAKRTLFETGSGTKGGILGFALSPDGSRAAFYTLGERVLRVMPVAGGGARELLRLENPEDFQGHGGALTWTPDGRSIVYGTQTAGTFPAKTELWMIGAEGGKPQKLALSLDRMTHATIHPDGTQVAFQNVSRSGEVWAMENLLPALKAAR
jgi:Tol biopolymer transport system component